MKLPQILPWASSKGSRNSSPQKPTRKGLPRLGTEQLRTQKELGEGGAQLRHPPCPGLTLKVELGPLTHLTNVLGWPRCPASTDPVAPRVLEDLLGGVSTGGGLGEGGREVGWGRQGGRWAGEE